jgi:3-oxoacyl-[acyl-carrier protein] reductase
MVKKFQVTIKVRHHLTSLKTNDMDLGLQNKRVLVTGSSRGIGEAIARGFLYEGAKVFITSRGSKQLLETEKKLIKEFGDNNVISSVCDCSDPIALAKLKNTILNEWDGIDVLVTNVGDGRSVDDILPNEAQWDKIWKNNFDSTINSVRAFLPTLQDSKGCILFISSIAGMESIGAPIDYSTAKTAVISFAKNLSKKLSNEVRVNVLSPGNILFPEGSWDEKIKQDPKKVNTLIKTIVPMQRFGSSEEVADAAVFLCSKRASFITGSVLVIDGGQTVGLI